MTRPVGKPIHANGIAKVKSMVMKAIADNPNPTTKIPKLSFFKETLKTKPPKKESKKTTKYITVTMSISSKIFNFLIYSSIYPLYKIK